MNWARVVNAFYCSNDFEIDGFFILLFFSIILFF